MHPNSINPKVIPYESTIPTYIRYLPAVPSKFVCAKLGLSVSSMLGGLFSRGVDSAPHSRENAWSSGCPVPCSNQIKIISNKNPLGLLLVGGTRWFGQAMDWCLLVVGEYKLYHSPWEPPIMCVAWKISRSLGCYVDNESMPLKILFISISKIELWHLYKSLLPSTKGLSIYFHVESSPSY